TLGCLLDDGQGISASRFDEVVGGAIDAIEARFPGRRVRAFGEMVDLLTARGRHDTAVALEGLWNDLAKTRRFSLLCGYNLDLFDAAAQKWPLSPVCDAHTHVRPAYDMARLDRAVFDALDEVLGSSSARMVHGIVREEANEHSEPAARAWFRRRLGACGSYSARSASIPRAPRRWTSSASTSESEPNSHTWRWGATSMWPDEYGNLFSTISAS